MNFYNEHDPAAAAWLRELIREGHIPDGVVDERDVQQLKGDDLAGFTQVHLFAGIGGWPLALRLAGSPDDRPVWTGSCPCQPFSSAGKRKATSDARHLWPDMRRLVAECRPSICFGEQVASKDGREWLAGVRADLEALGYAVGAADLCAAGAGAPHIRQRLFWVGDAEGAGHARREHRGPLGEEACGGTWVLRARRSGEACRVGHADREGRQQERRGAPGHEGSNGTGSHGDHLIAGPGAARRMADAQGRARGLSDRKEWPEAVEPDRAGEAGGLGNAERHGLRVSGRAASDVADQSGYWSLFDVIPCRDGKARRVEPGTFPLAHGIPGRVGLLRGYGNAIVPQVAAAFIEAFLEARAALEVEVAA